MHVLLKCGSELSAGRYNQTYLEKHLQLGLIVVPQARLGNIDNVPVLVSSFGCDSVYRRLPALGIIMRD